ncbi:DUF6993 domain-containing protein [Pseudarthrobacter sp. J1763]|uniref:DUF6993 domain-containing protein n=1 Tax=Pseudarthrobacter sp. J1763 TaxID=3420445 RepID=UPI003D2BE1D5
MNTRSRPHRVGSAMNLTGRLRVIGTSATAVAAAVVLAGCSVFPSAPSNDDSGMDATNRAIAGPQSSGQAKAQQPNSASPKIATTYSPAVSAMLTKLQEAGITSTEADSTATTVALRSAIVAQGIATSAVEISQSTTPTGLAADALTAAVRADSQCVYVQVRDKTVTTSVVKALANGKCFLGDQH